MSSQGPISDKELAALIKQELTQSGNWAGSELREAIKDSLNYFLLRMKGDEVDGRSQIQSGDVADMIDHVHAEMQPMYDVEELCVIGEEGPGDEDDAQMESDAVNWYWRERARGFDKLDMAVQDGLTSRTGYLKVWYEESLGLPYEETLQGDELQINAAIAQLENENRVELLEEQQTQEAQVVPVAPISEIVGDQVPMVIAPAQFAVRLKVTPIHREVKADCPAPEDMFVSKDSVSTNLQEPRFVAQRRLMSRQDIKALGLDHDQVDQIPEYSYHDSDVRQSRQTEYNTFSRYAAHQGGQQAELFEVYYKVDRDGDGLPELWKIFYSDIGELMRWTDGTIAAEMVRARPFAAGTPMKVAHRHEGRSVWDKERQIEDFKRDVMRQMLDNLHQANDSTLAVARNVSEDDVIETDTGRVIRCNSPQTDIAEVRYNNITGDSLQALMYGDKVRDERVSSAITHSSGQNMPVGNTPAHTTERIMSAGEKMVGMFARNLANALVRDTFVLLHQQLRLMPGRLAFQSGDGWQETEPRYWVERTRISAGLAPSEGEKLRKQAALRETIELQARDSEDSFGILVDYDALYQARLDFCRNAGLDDPRQYWMDPSSPEAQRKIAMDAQQAQQQQEMAMMQSRMMYEVQMRMVQMQEDTKRFEAQLDALEAQRDRIAKLTVEMTKLEASTGEEIPFGLMGETDARAVQ